MIVESHEPLSPKRSVNSRWKNSYFLKPVAASRNSSITTKSQKKGKFEILIRKPANCQVRVIEFAQFIISMILVLALSITAMLYFFLLPDVEIQDDVARVKRKDKSMKS